MDFFGIGILELLVIVVVALLVLGPDQLPRMAGRLAGVLKDARRSIADAQEAFSVNIDPPERRPEINPVPTRQNRDSGDPRLSH